MKELKDRLISARKIAKKTQKEICEAVGMSQPSYSDLEKGISKRTALIVEISVFLGVNPVWLAIGAGPRELNASHIDPQFIASTPEEQVFLLDFRDATKEARKEARAALLGDNARKKIGPAGRKNA